MCIWRFGIMIPWVGRSIRAKGIRIPIPVSPWLLLAWLCLLGFPAQGDGIRPDANLEIQDSERRSAAILQVEIADTPATRERGLMGRVLVDDGVGMLFIFPKAAPQTFWMRNTPASLDMLFADDDLRIIHIVSEAPPLSDRLYSSQGPARYVLETRGGFAARHGIVTGMWLSYVLTPPSGHP